MEEIYESEKRRSCGQDQDMEKVTVVIPNYNGIKFIEECLRSLLSQEEGTPRYRVLVVDNGSKDGSRQLVEERFPGVDLIPLEENTGFCHAVNVGIEASAAPYVILLNNDTKVRPHFIKGLYEAMEADEKAFSASARMLMWDRPDLLDGAGDRYCVLGWAYSRGKGRPAAFYDRTVKVFSACGGAAIYRKSILDKIGLFDEAHFAYLEDLDLGYRAQIYGYYSLYEPSAEVIHFGSASSGSRYNEWKTSLAAANSVYIIAKNMPLLQWLWNLPLLLVGFFIKFLFFCRKKMGLVYLKGLWKGLQKSFSKTGRIRKNIFHIRNTRRYFSIQWQLYANFFRLLKKT